MTWKHERQVIGSLISKINMFFTTDGKRSKNTKDSFLFTDSLKKIIMNETRLGLEGPRALIQIFTKSAES